MADTDGRALVMQTHAADIQDRDGTVPLLKASRKAFPFVERVFADSAYAGERVADATRIVVESCASRPNRSAMRRCPSPPAPRGSSRS